jgi:hypothetical protein
MLNTYITERRHTLLHIQISTPSNFQGYLEVITIGRAEECGQEIMRNAVFVRG